jgi:hypothetical protein
MDEISKNIFFLKTAKVIKIMRIRFDRKIQGGCNLKKNHNKISYN